MALLAELGMPALGALVFLVIVVLAVICWVIASGDRTDRVSQMMLARRGEASFVAPGTAAASTTVGCPGRAPGPPHSGHAQAPPPEQARRPVSVRGSSTGHLAGRRRRNASVHLALSQLGCTVNV